MRPLEEAMKSNLAQMEPPLPRYIADAVSNFVHTTTVNPGVYPIAFAHLVAHAVLKAQDERQIEFLTSLNETNPSVPTKPFTAFQPERNITLWPTLK
jgi:hypothetical protein